MATDTQTTEVTAQVIKKRKSKAPVYSLFVVLVALAAAGDIGYMKMRANHALVQSENAVSVTDTQSILAKVTGRLSEVFVKPGQVVTAGQVVAIIENPDLLVAYKKAQQDLVDATKQDNATQAAILPPPISGGFNLGPPPDFSKLKPLPAIGNQPQSISPPPATGPAKDPREAAKEDAAKAVLAKDTQSLAKANDDYRTSQSETEEAKSSYQAAMLPVDSLKSAVDLAKAKREKFEGLYNDGIISRSEFQQKQNDLDTAQASLNQANQNVDAADDNVKAKQTAEDNLSKQIVTLQAAVAKDQTQVAALDKEATSDVVKTPPTKPFVANLPPMPPPLAHHRGRYPAPNFAPPPGSLAPVRVAFSADKHVAAETKVEKAQRILREIQAKIDACRIVSHSDGAVTKINFKVGDPVAQDAVLLTLMTPSSQRVIATFGHEQALRIRYGQKCEVQFAQYPGRVFFGQIARFLDAGGSGAAAKVEILIPDRTTVLSMLPPGAPTTVHVHTS